MADSVPRQVSPPRIDLNADLGETKGDLDLMEVVTSANVACGGHAGDEVTMAAAHAAARAHGVVVGAHPSYADREGFGRRERHDPPEAVAAEVLAQVTALASLGEVAYVKLHGALYHRANSDAALADALVAALETTAVRHLLALPGALATAGARRGFLITVEGFCDRAYGPDGSLVDRAEPGALLHGEAALDQAVRLVGTVGSLCVHGDSPGALDLARAVRRRLESEGVVVAPFAAPPPPG